MKTIQEFKKYNEEITQSTIEDILSGQDLNKIIKEALKSDSKEEAQKYEKYFWGPKANWGISTGDLSKMDLSKYPLEALLRIKFSTETIWPTADKLPQGFNPKELIEKAKTFKGLGVEKLHQSGIKGESVTIAYIDKPFDVEHIEFKDRNIEYVDLSEGQDFDFHGYAVMSRLCGKNIGIAPDAKVIYYAQKQGGKDHCFELAKSGLKALKDIIKRVKNNERIDAIGQSGEIDYQISFIKDETKREILKEELKKIKEELEELNIPFLDSYHCWKSKFSYSFYADPSSRDENLLISHSKFIKKNDTIDVIDAWKCIPMPYTKDGYLYENSLGCDSWSIPQVVGLFALAKQVDMELSFEEFTEICKTTAITNQFGTKLINAEEMIKEVEFRKENRNEI